ncbi:hypothetical protein Sjap_004749 [Stephania japonica]|uniref:Uncharacterized protein n=1 Tax=Stephania japonica TaxID=461633 RepID=A0AAP0K302_9MAGN
MVFRFHFCHRCPVLSSELRTLSLVDDLHPSFRVARRLFTAHRSEEYRSLPPMSNLSFHRCGRDANRW